jgi:hypothetical protein
MNELPFEQIVKENYRIRTFSESVNEYELKWHQDEEDRLVVPIHNSDWMIQLDNELPIPIIEGKKIFIPKYNYHRLIKGNGDLELKIFFV